MNFLISVCNPKALPLLTQICNELDIKMPISMLGRGTAVRSMLDILGIEDNERRVLLGIADRDKTQRFLKAQKERMYIGVPGHGITVAIPIKSIGGGKTMAYLDGEKYTPQINGGYELIVAIANEGRTDQVMNAARHAGARGGTVLHGKGTAGEAAQKFLNVSIASEKEVILIVAQQAQKVDIMAAILREAGPDTHAGAVVFSMPIADVAGFGFPDKK